MTSHKDAIGMDNAATSAAPSNDVSWEQLMASAQAHDEGKLTEAPAEVTKTTEQAPPDPKAEKPDDKEPEVPDKGEQPEADSKSSLKSDPKAEAKQTEKANEPEKSKWKQNEERKAKTWEQINAEKEQIRKEREEFQRQREEFERQRVAKQADEPLRDERGFSAKDYAEFAKQSRESNPELASAAEKRAQELTQREAQHRQELARKSVEDGWNKSYEQAVARLPDLKDQNSDIHKEVLATLGKYPALKQSPQGLEAAIERAELAIKARDVEARASEIKELKSKLTEYEKKLAIGPGSPDAKLSSPKKFDEMDSAAQFKALEQEFAKLDND